MPKLTEQEKTEIRVQVYKTLADFIEYAEEPLNYLELPNDLQTMEGYNFAARIMQQLIARLRSGERIG